MQLSHARPVVSATFDEPNLVSAAGLVPLMALAGKAGLRELAAERLSVPTDKGANAGSKLSALVAVIAAQRLRKGSVGSPRGAARLATDTLALIRRSRLAGRDVLVRADSAFYSHALVVAALRAGADVSITVRMDPAVKRAIAAIDED